jgi:hypothetical protein
MPRADADEVVCPMRHAIAAGSAGVVAIDVPLQLPPSCHYSKRPSRCSLNWFGQLFGGVSPTGGESRVYTGHLVPEFT